MTENDVVSAFASTNLTPTSWRKARVALAIVAIVLGGLAFLATRSTPQRVEHASKPALASARPPRTDDGATQEQIRFYKARVERDAEDTRSQNALAELYLQEVRQSGNEDYLPLALKAACASLNAVDAERNLGGLTTLAHAEFANHDFRKACDDALRLIAFDPSKTEAYAILGDARLELGEYNGAAEAFAQMQRLSEKNPGTETRLARLAFLHGNTTEARQHFSAALTILLALPDAAGETIAWHHWQLGETAFSTGDLEEADRSYRAALTSAPNDFRALASLGRLYAARGDLPGAIELYEEATRIAPVSDFMAALGDLYALSERPKDAAARYDLVEQLAEHSRKVHNSAFNRNLAVFYANHDMKPEEAYSLVHGEYAAGRRDVYGADALAWAALKSGRVSEAQLAMKEALRLGTRDAKLFYHAGMIARAAGDKSAALAYLKSALRLNSKFDPLQCAAAQHALEELER